MNRLFICGVKNYSSTNWIIHKNFKVRLNEGIKWKSPFSLKCSEAKTRKATALMDPNKISFYSGVPQYNKSDYHSPSIFRTNFKITNNSVLDPIDIQTSQNYQRIWPHGGESDIDPEERIYFRVARVCKNDNGSLNKPRTWTTYAKARLNCPSFETMNSIYKVQKNDTFFYGIFSTLKVDDNFRTTFNSGICIFHIDDINKAFDGEFMKVEYRGNATSDPVDIPQARPKLCQQDLSNYHNTTGDYLIMNTVIQPVMGGPIFELRNEQSYLTKIVVDKITKSVCGIDVEFIIIYAGTSRGEVYNIFQWTEGKKIKTELRDKFQVSPEDEEIKAMEISPNHKSIYVATAHRVKQINLKICEKLKNSLFDLYCELDVGDLCHRIYSILEPYVS
ncbi:hypothetical protein HCN44_007953 [Aphidius gifuensis]|uniref:Sema domain-containing protein n=1 Tax=Aphidius gifuensis TaxID=684658 RepID=A0A835CLX9_APHGI|nr:hypothetical protein HCN44_007953 [Aphidius gifuensis]